MTQILNKKILGATPTQFNNITFRSILECSCYKKLVFAGLNFIYEPDKTLLWEGIKLQNLVFYAPKKNSLGKYSKNLVLNTRALMNITYTPDFLITIKDYKIYFDVKGHENDVYPIKRKMFLKVLESKNDGFKYMFFEPHNVRQILEAIEIIKKL